MVAVAYRRWSFTRGSNCKALTGKVLVFWIDGRLREVVAHGGSTVQKKMVPFKTTRAEGFFKNVTPILSTIKSQNALAVLSVIKDDR